MQQRSIVEQECRIAADFDIEGFTISTDILSESQCSALSAEVASLEVAGAGTRELLALGWARLLACERALRRRLVACL